MAGFRTLTAGLALGVTLGLAAGCGGGGGGGAGGGGSGTPRDVQVFWAANREKAVNSPGGGYRVYYSTTPGFDLAAARVVDVPYVAGPRAPTSATIAGLSPGTYYLRVVAYSALNPPGGSGGSTSAPSIEISVTVP